MEGPLVIILVSLLFSAFFSGMEIAYVSANKIHLEIEKKQNNFIATVLKRITLRPSKFIATMLVGNNIALVIYGLFMGEVMKLSQGKADPKVANKLVREALEK